MEFSQHKRVTSYMIILSMVFAIFFCSGIFSPKVFATVTPAESIQDMPLNSAGTVKANWDQDSQTLKITGTGKIDKDNDHWWALPKKIHGWESPNEVWSDDEHNKPFTLDMTDRGIILPDDSSMLFQNFPGEIKMNPDLDTSNVTNMELMFSGASKANVDVSKWNISNVTKLNAMFADATSMNPDVSKWNVGKVKEIYKAFLNSGVKNLDLSAWNLSENCDTEDLLTGIPLLTRAKVKNFEGYVGKCTSTHPNENGFAAPFYVLICDNYFNITKVLNDDVERIENGVVERGLAITPDTEMPLERGNYIITTKKPIRITFESHEGSAVAPLILENGDRIKEPTPAPTRSEYKFLGWFKGEDGNDRWNFQNIPTEDMTLHAHWEKIDAGQDPHVNPEPQPGQDPQVNPEPQLGQDPQVNPEPKPGQDPQVNPEPQPGQNPQENQEQPSQDPKQKPAQEPSKNMPATGDTENLYEVAISALAMGMILLYVSRKRRTN